MYENVFSFFQYTNDCESGLLPEVYWNAKIVNEPEFPCWYHPTDKTAQSVLEKPSTAWV